MGNRLTTITKSDDISSFASIVTDDTMTVIQESTDDTQVWPESSNLRRAATVPKNSGNTRTDSRRSQRVETKIEPIYEPDETDADALAPLDKDELIIHGRKASALQAAAPLVLAMSGIGPAIRKRSWNKQRLSDFSDIEHLVDGNYGIQLTPKQKLLLQTAWTDSNRKGGNKSGEWIFRRIFTHQPDMKEVFRLDNVPVDQLVKQSQFQKHAQLFADVLEMAVQSMDALDDSMGPLLVSYGSKHATFVEDRGFRPEYWDIFSEAMCEYAANWKIKNHRLETIQAWRMLIMFIVTKVKQGYELEIDPSQTDLNKQMVDKQQVKMQQIKLQQAKDHKRFAHTKHLSVDNYT